MGKLREVEPAVLITGIIYTGDNVPEPAAHDLEEAFGPVAFASDAFVFDMTDYYTAEMGPDLHKIFHCFERLIDPVELAGIKLITNEIEQTYAVGDTAGPKRRINIDPGYVTLSKLVLASTKDYSHRIYIGNRIYAETTLRYESGSFHAIDTTYPDYKTPLVLNFMGRARDYLKGNRGTWNRPNE